MSGIAEDLVSLRAVSVWRFGGRTCAEKAGDVVRASP